MNYKDTLLMPQSAFPMRAGLAEKEPKYIEAWQKLDLYKAMNQNRENAPTFALHDGPPYEWRHALRTRLKPYLKRHRRPV